jgi:spore germination cell wall hydrolase CwlJ-like protein
MTFAVRSSKGAFKSLALIAVAVGLPATLALASEAGLAAPLPNADPQLVSTSLDARSLDASLSSPVSQAAAQPSAKELECMAKVVLHEAGNQSREGQLAVAQIMLNRKQSGRFADSICGVAAQRGQFFDLAAYNPNRDQRWTTALDVARDAMTGEGDEIAPGALYFHAATHKASTFFRTRQKVASIGAHIFYR